MIEGLTSLITSQGWLAPAWYVAGFLFAAVVPIIPTPLIAALGGTAFGTVPAILYGTVGLALGAGLALLLARQLGRRVMRSLVPEKVWSEWEGLLGIRSLGMWFVIFLVLNMDVAVMAAGLSSLSARSLWLTVMAARLPWLVVAAWAGETLLVNDAALIVMVLVMIPVVWGLGRLRPAVRRRLARWAGADIDGPAAPGPVMGDPAAAEPGTVDAGEAPPGTLEPGTLEPGTVRRGTVESGRLEPGTVESGAVESGAVEPGSLDRGSADAGAGALDPAGSPTDRARSEQGHPRERS